MKTKQAQHAPGQSLPQFVKDKIKHIGGSHFLNGPPALVDVNAPRALMQCSGEGQIIGITWAASQPLYAAAPELLDLVKRFRALLCDRLSDGTCECVELIEDSEDVITKAEGR